MTNLSHQHICKGCLSHLFRILWAHLSQGAGVRAIIPDRFFFFIFLFGSIFACLVHAKDKDMFSTLPSVEPNPNTRVPLAAIVRFDTEATIAKTTITVKNSDNEWSFDYDGDRDPAEGLPVIGFRPGKAHRITVAFIDVQGRTIKSDPVTYRAPALPTAPEEFPKINLVKVDTGRAEPGYRLFNPRRRIPRETQAGNENEKEFGESFGMLLIVDQKGEPVWYYRAQSRIAGFEYNKESGRILYITADYRAVEIDLLGNVTHSWVAANRPQEKPSDAIPVDVLTFHHDADLFENGNLLALSSERRRIQNYFTSEWDEDAPRKDQWVMGDRIVEVAPDGEILWDWKAFDHLPVRRIGYETFSRYWKRRGFPETIDWSHANEVTRLDNGSIMVNFRYQSAIVNFDPQSGEIRWIFGEPSGWPEDLQNKLIRLEDDARWFWHQHAPLFTSRSTLLVFDNGNYRARPFEKSALVADTWSRAVEYEIDFEKNTAHQVWTSETAHDESERVVTIAMGSATEMPETGNILAGYGAILDPDPIDEITWQNRARFGQITRCVEYTRTHPAKVVWDLRLEPTGCEPRISWNLFGLRAVKKLRP
jgi:arylsulfate sulfotransferase